MDVRDLDPTADCCSHSQRLRQVTMACPAIYGRVEHALPLICQMWQDSPYLWQSRFPDTLKAMTHRNVPAEMLAYIRQAAAGPDGPPSASVIAEHLKVSRRTVNRPLARLVANGQLEKSGSGPATAYRPISTPTSASSDGPSLAVARSGEAAALLVQLSRA